MSNCLQCHQETSNPKFCSRSCSASFVGKTQPKRKPKERVCATCGTVFFYKGGRKTKYCSPGCTQVPKGRDITLKQAIYTLHHRSSAYALVRTRARAIALRLGMKSCAECGYSKHVEITHTQAISGFSEDTLLSVINDPSNLRPLCRNCHWESEHPI
jgi:hypothetical protein